MKYIYYLIFLLCSTSAFAQASRGAFVEEISNERSSFAVRVDVDRSDRVYAKNDLLQATIKSSEDGYLYLLYRDAVGKVSVLFPNRFQKDNFVQKNRAITVPAPESNFLIRIDVPFGDELLKAVITKKPRTDIDTMAFTRADVTLINEGTAKSFAKSFENEAPDWAEHQVRIRTATTRSGVERPIASSDGGERFAIGIGVSDYKDTSISNLRVCHIDAEKILDMLVKRCGVKKDNTILLTNEKATLANIRKTVREELPRLTQPGDTVFLFWSGHGGRTEDRQKEFLVPYDGSNRNIEKTMLMDEAFGRWIQELDGRKVLVIIDACHSGGMAARAKSRSKAQDEDADWKPLHFAFTRLATAKNIDQKDAAVIASSTSSQYSFVRKERDLSVFAYYVLQTVLEARTPLSHVQLYEAVKPLVSRYVEENIKVEERHKDAKQDIVMQDDMTKLLILTTGY